MTSSFRILNQIVKFTDGSRPDEVNDFQSEDNYRTWKQGTKDWKTCPKVIQGSSQQEFITFEIKGGTIYGIERINEAGGKGTWYLPGCRTIQKVVIGDRGVGIHSFEFPKEEQIALEHGSIALGDYYMETIYRDASGRELCKRSSKFSIVKAS